LAGGIGLESRANLRLLRRLGEALRLVPELDTDTLLHALDELEVNLVPRAEPCEKLDRRRREFVQVSFDPRELSPEQVEGTDAAVLERDLLEEAETQVLDSRFGVVVTEGGGDDRVVNGILREETDMLNFFTVEEGESGAVDAVGEGLWRVDGEDEEPTRR
jgi:hypothetical protein